MYKEIIQGLYCDHMSIKDVTISFDLEIFIPFISRMKEDRSVIIIKMDGEREKDVYTIVCTGELLGERNFLRMDTSDLNEGMAYVCCKYAEIVWGWDINSFDGMYKKIIESLCTDYMIASDIALSDDLDVFFSFISKMREDQSIFIVKIDGERDDDIYMVHCSGTALGMHNPLSIDTSDLGEGIAYVCCKYAEIVWGWNAKA
ncbi:hypothetical protein [Thermoactinomyces sp. DSM 45892]|uniref:hypothetical protein n=1 Tax=Thermoactinomyces sp. DSM 45892 TaxID=1882753 RepID=UPI00089B06DA|nr:hypothetical protein [Thermoactinomyces sp. DSM 45892]SDZ31974.1 hypothetical protein SAMN05444416_1213 [Thermoactinomyces sp. DSM 45892]